MKDPVAENIMVKQFNINFLNRMYRCTEKQAVLQAAIMMQINFGDFNPDVHKVGFLK